MAILRYGKVVDDAGRIGSGVGSDTLSSRDHRGNRVKMSEEFSSGGVGNMRFTQNCENTLRLKEMSGSLEKQLNT